MTDDADYENSVTSANPVEGKFAQAVLLLNSLFHLERKRTGTNVLIIMLEKSYIQHQ